MLRIATRRSALARAQAHQVGEQISAAIGEPFELVPMATSGDRSPTRAVTAFETKGLFVDTIREAVANGDCDLAVHSYKDLPTGTVDGLVLAAVPAREDPRDLLVTRDGKPLSGLGEVATVGTSSERRRLQLLRARPGLHVLPLRGNLDTRLRKVADGEFDAVVVAFAGLRRLYVPPEHGGAGPLRLPLKAVPLEPGECLSAAGQGALAVECRAGDAAGLRAGAVIDDPASRRGVAAERAFLERVGGGCLAPVGALAVPAGPGTLELAGMIADPGRRRVLRRSTRGPEGDPAGLGARLADELAERGGDEILAAIADRRERAETDEAAGAPGPEAAT